MCNSSLTLSDWMLIITAVFTGGILLVAFLAYRTFLVQETRKRQLDIVVQLVERLKYIQFKLALVKMIDGNPTFINIDISTFFTIRKSSRPKKNIRLFVPSSGDSFIWLDHFTNPLMPTKIVEAWEKLIRGQLPRPFFNSPTAPETFYCVYNNLEEISNEILRTYFEINEGTEQFFDGVFGLRKEIRKWFRKHGINDINTNVITKIT